MEGTHVSAMPQHLEHSTQEKPSRLQWWARVVYVAGLVCSIALIVPAQWFPLQVGKLAVFATCLALATILFVLSRRGIGAQSNLRDRATYYALITLLLPLAYLVSMYFSTDPSIALFGQSLEAHTVLFALLGVAALFVGSLLFRTQMQVRMLQKAILLSVLFAALFQALVILFGNNLIPLQVFADRSTNLIGKWNDFGLLLGILALWSLVYLEWTPLSLVRRILLVVLLVVLGLLLGLVQFSVVWGLICFFSLISAAAYYLVHRPSESPRFSVANTPWYSLLVAGVSVLFIVFGSSFNTALTRLLPVSSLEVRPSYEATLAVVQASHTAPYTAFVGTGPGTFNQQWTLYKPAEVNLSAFWNLDFSVGYSSLFTAFAEAGLLGAAALLVPLVLVLLALARILRSRDRSHEDRLLGTMLGGSAVYLWLSTGVYVPSQNVLLLAFVVSGVLIGFAYGPFQTQPEHSRPRWRGFAALLSGLLLILVPVSLAYHLDRFFLAEAYTNVGIIALSNGQPDAATKAADSARTYAENGEVLRLGVQAGLAKMQQIASAATAPDAAAQQQFTLVASSTIAQGLRSIALSPQDYRSSLLLGQVYDFLASINVQNAYQLAKAQYASTTILNPTLPVIPLLQARLEATHGTLKDTQSFIDKTLTLKPNYTDAILFVVQFNVDRKDLNGAILAAQAAVQSAPGIASIWFQLGLLYYTAEQMANAITALEQAVTLQSDYANAKYFLGLAYYAQDRTADAIKQFQDLQSSNPENQEVKLILSNMEAGKAPFTSAEPPVTDRPETRATAPISQ